MEGLGKGRGSGVTSDGESGWDTLRLPVVSLLHFSQDELLQMSRAQGCRLADTYFSQIIVPDLDRKLFNESDGSKKQTYRNWEDYWPKQPGSKDAKENGGGDVKQHKEDKEEDEQLGKRKHRRKKTTYQRLINRPVYSEKRKKRLQDAEARVAPVAPPKTWTSPRRALANEADCLVVNTGMGALVPAISKAGQGKQQVWKVKRASRLGRTTVATGSGSGYGRDMDDKPVISEMHEDDDDDQGASVPVTIIPSGRSQGFSVPFEIRAVREDLASEDAQVTLEQHGRTQVFAVPSDIKPVLETSVSQGTWVTWEHIEASKGFPRQFESLPADSAADDAQLTVEDINSRLSSSLSCESRVISDPVSGSTQVTSDESRSVCEDFVLEGTKATLEHIDGTQLFPPPFESRGVSEDFATGKAQVTPIKSQGIPLPFESRVVDSFIPIHGLPLLSESRVVREVPVAEAVPFASDDISRSQGFPLPCETRASHVDGVSSESFPLPFENRAVRGASVAGNATLLTLEVTDRSQDLPLPFENRAAGEASVAGDAAHPTWEFTSRSQDLPLQFENRVGCEASVSVDAAQLTLDVTYRSQGLPQPENRAVREAAVAGDAARLTLEVTRMSEDLPLPFENRAVCGGALATEPAEQLILEAVTCKSQDVPLPFGTRAVCEDSTQLTTAVIKSHGVTLELVPINGSRSLELMSTGVGNESVGTASDFEHVHFEPMQIDMMAPAETDSESGNMHPQVKAMTGPVDPVVQLVHTNMNFMPMERDAALSEIAPDVSIPLFEIAPEETISYVQLALEASNSVVELDPEATVSSIDVAPVSSSVIASEAALSFVEIATEDGDMRWHLKDSEVSAAPVVSTSELGCALLHCVQCEADVASMQSDSETDPEESMLRQAEVNAAAIASGLCTMGWMKDVVLEASDMGTTSGLYHLDMNAVSADTSFDSSDTSLEPVDIEMKAEISPIEEQHTERPLMEAITAYNTEGCSQLLEKHGRSASDDGNLEEGKLIAQNSVYHANISMIGESVCLGNTTQSSGIEKEQVGSGDDGGILMLERFIEMMSQGHSKEFSKQKLEIRGGKRKLAVAQQDYIPFEETRSKMFKPESPPAFYLNSEERVIHDLEGDQGYEGLDKPPPLEGCTGDTNGVKENTESIGETSELEKKSLEPKQLQQISSTFIGVPENPTPFVSWGFPVPLQGPEVTSVISAIDQPCESGVTNEVLNTDQHEQETCKEGTESKQAFSVPNVEARCTADPPSSPRQPKLKAEMERRLAAIEGKWLTDKRKVVVADNFPEGWTVCVFLRTKGGRATLEYRSWKSPEGKVFGTFKDAAEYVQSSTGVVVKNRGLLKTEQAREKKILQPGGVAASHETASPLLMYDCRICDSRFTSEVALMQHKIVHDLSYTELRELSHLQKLEAQRSAPTQTQVPFAEGPRLEKATSACTPCVPSSNVVTQDKVAITCSICSGTFSCKKNLRRHMQRRHPDNQYKGLISADNPTWRSDLQNVQPPANCVS